MGRGMLCVDESRYRKAIEPKDEEGSGIVKRGTGIETNVGEDSPSPSSVSNVTSTEQTYVSPSMRATLSSLKHYFIHSAVTIRRLLTRCSYSNEACLLEVIMCRP